MMRQAAAICKHSARTHMILGLLVAPALLAMLATAAAQTAPAPRSMPRIPVNQQTIYTRNAPARDIQGTATIIDGEKLRIGDNELRLFGIVPPQLSANFGPQARGILDTLTNGQNVLCQVRDRDREGRLLVTCHNGNGNDLALELLKRGLAVTARGSIANTDLANIYVNAEQAAQTQKLGLWSVNAPAASALASSSMTTPAGSAASPSEITKAENLIAAIPTPSFLKDKTDDTKVAEKTGDALAAATEKAVKPVAITPVSSHAMIPLPPGSSEIDNDVPASVTGVQPSFIERYQLLLTGVIMLATALSILTILTARQRNERRDEIRAIAAALRGELMAARSVCQSRARAITSEAEDKAAPWPRLRVTLYQAYVGRLGFLGSELARQIASIYGQASDYASYYNTDLDRTDSAPKRQALQNLVNYIDEVTPRLALIEQSGLIPTNYTPSYVPPASHHPTSTGLPSANHQQLAAPRTATFATNSASLTPPASSSTATRAIGMTTRTPPASSLLASASAPVSSIPTSSPETSQPAATELPTASMRTRIAARRAASMPKPVAPVTNKPAEDGPSAAYLAAMQAPIHLWEAVRNFAREHLADRQQAADDGIGEYSRLMEDDMAAYSYDDPDDDLVHRGYSGKLRDTGS